MLASFRRHLNSWVARTFFMLLVAMFVLWGVGDVIRNIGFEDTSVATVAGERIEMPEAQQAYQRQLQQVTRALGGKTEPSADMRKAIAAQAIDQLITQVALNAAVAGMGLAVPDAALRQAIYAMPAFHNPQSQFDRTLFLSVLSNNNMSEQRFLDLVRTDLGQRQLMDAARAGAISPDTLDKVVFEIQHETRIADAVDIPFSAAAPPPAPTEQQLMRWYENHKDKYSTPEYRHIKAIVLSAETVGKDIQVSEDELKAAYEQRKASYNQPEKRTVQVLLAKDEAQAKTLAEKWSSGADWAAMQKDGASPVELTDATKDEIPSPELAAAVFGAPEGQVSAPVHDAVGWHVFRVEKITPGATKAFEQARDELRTQVIADKAADVIYDRSSKIDDLLAGGTALDALPGDMGLGAVMGTLDSYGNTKEGKPAPIPGSKELVQALVKTAFSLKKGDPPSLTEAPRAANGVPAYYAVAVDDIIPPAPKPYDDVAADVRADWTQDAIRHEQEVIAANILAAVKGGEHLAQAAVGMQVQRLPPVSRGVENPEVPPQLVEALFGLKVGEATMIETADGFMVAELVQVQQADPNADPVGFGRTRDALTQSIGNDVQAVLTQALRARANPKVNATQLDSIAQPD
jgi:peptidyl-prolyl cis-trans isomerase D